MLGKLMLLGLSATLTLGTAPLVQTEVTDLGTETAIEFCMERLETKIGVLESKVSEGLLTQEQMDEIVLRMETYLKDGTGSAGLQLGKYLNGNGNKEEALLRKAFRKESCGNCEGLELQRGNGQVKGQGQGKGQGFGKIK